MAKPWPAMETTARILASVGQQETLNLPSILGSDISAARNVSLNRGKNAVSQEKAVDVRIQREAAACDEGVSMPFVRLDEENNKQDGLWEWLSRLANLVQTTVNTQNDPNDQNHRAGLPRPLVTLKGPASWDVAAIFQTNAPNQQDPHILLLPPALCLLPAIICQTRQLGFVRCRYLAVHLDTPRS